MTYLPPFKHQEETCQFWIDHPRMFCTSDPGTGKTRSHLDGFRMTKQKGSRMLVLAPLTILKPSWGEDTEKFTGLSYAIAHGSPIKRQKAFETSADIVLMNHDGIVWLADKIKKKEIDLKALNFTHLAIDEFTAFKNRTTKRSKALNSIVDCFEYISMMSGTPNSNTILDMFWPAFMLDRGKRLGSNFFKFRGQVCHAEPVPNTTFQRWIDKPSGVDAVAAALADITIRHALEDCIDMPEHVMTVLKIDMPRDVIKQYRDFEKTALYESEEGMVSAIHAGAKAKKLLQFLSGAIYNSDGKIVKVHPHRYELVMDLVAEREQCVVAFNWKHERDQLIALAEKYNFSYGVIDGDVNNTERTKVVERFQNGELKIIFAHPQSAGHGLTLTKGTTTIWPTPTYNAEHFQQLNRRIYRAGQTRRTETICIAASSTKEEDVYERLNSKLDRMEDLLNIFTEVSK